MAALLICIVFLDEYKCNNYITYIRGVMRSLCFEIKPCCTEYCTKGDLVTFYSNDTITKCSSMDVIKLLSINISERELIAREEYIRTRRQGEPGCGDFESNAEAACKFYLKPQYCSDCGFDADASKFIYMYMPNALIHICGALQAHTFYPPPYWDEHDIISSET